MRIGEPWLAGGPSDIAVGLRDKVDDRAHAAAFQTVSMDNHPVHYDAEWARRYGPVAPVVHGLQVLAFTAPGATLFPHFIGEVFISFLELSCTFLAEVHSGDTCTRHSRSPAWSRRATTAS